VYSAAILNGGQARRFGGRDKGALPVAGRSIRQHQLDVLADVADDVMIVGGDDTAGVATHPGTLRWLHDRDAGRGPLSGMETALLEARHDLVVVVACDMPGVTATLLRALLALTDDADVVVPRSESGYHPLCAVYRAATCAPLVSQRLAAGQLAVTGLFPHLRLRELGGDALAGIGDPRRLLANVNTPADHDALATLLAHEL
jgi:molybdopterin-guanine dinucleotide biosynthesis protein A